MGLDLVSLSVSSDVLRPQLDAFNSCLSVCVHKQKTRLARIVAVKSGGASAYLQYKHSRLVGAAEEVKLELVVGWC